MMLKQVNNAKKLITQGEYNLLSNLTYAYLCIWL